MRRSLHFTRIVGIAVCLTTALLLSACQISIGGHGRDQHEEQKTHMTENGEKTAMTCPMRSMHDANMKSMSSLMDVLAEAKKALDAGDAQLAAAKIAEAQNFIEQHQKKMRERMEDREKKMSGQKCHKGMQKGPEGESKQE